MAFNTTGKILKLIRSFSFWSQQVGHDYQQDNQSHSKNDLKPNREITACAVYISDFLCEDGLKKVKLSFSNGQAKISQSNELQR